MSYNWKCCSFYPNNFDASALTSVGVHMSFGRGTHVPRSGYTCPSVGVRMYFVRGTMTLCALSGQTHQNYSDKNCNISNCKTLIINVLDLLILDIFRIFIV